MGKCGYCSEIVEQSSTKPRKYCSDACRKADARRREKTDTIDNGQKKTDTIKRGRLRPFNDVFKTVGWGSLTKAEQDERHKDMVAAGVVLTGGYSMTASEQANYKPADQLGKGEHDHVSKPGDADYDGVCTPEWIAERCKA